MIDVHAHMQDNAFSQDLEGVVHRAKSKGIHTIISNGLNYEDSLACLQVASKFSAIESAIGLYPLENPNQLRAILDLIRESDNIVAVGEIGLDYAFEKREWQIPVFQKQVELAIELDLPVCVHSRSAGKYVLRELKELGAEKVLLHGFSGSKKDLKRVVELDYFVSIPATIIHDIHKQELVSQLPLENMLLETDSPVLSPIGGRNEPANLVYGLEKIAELKGVDEKDLERITDKNAKGLFKL